eukprot:6696342-Prymnesium_polylepis.1
MLAALHAAAVVAIHTPTVRIPSRSRTFVIAQQSPDLREVSSDDELQAAISDGPSPGVTLLMLSLRGCAKAAKVKKFLLDKTDENPMLQRVHWECDGDDADATASTLSTFGTSVTPFFVALNPEHGRVMDFVALSPSALFYGLDNLGVSAAQSAESSIL